MNVKGTNRTFKLLCVRPFYIYCEPTVLSLHTYKNDIGNGFFPDHWPVVRIGFDNGQVPDKWTCQQRGLGSIIPMCHLRVEWDPLLPLRVLPIVWCQLELAVDGSNQGRPNVRHNFNNRLCVASSPTPNLGFSVALQCLSSIMSAQYVGRCP
jgi:hypothetical protein